MKAAKYFSLFILCAAIFLQGCAVAAASLAGYMDMKSKYAKPYEEYRVKTEEANTLKLAQGEQAEPVKDFNTWIKDQPLTNNQIKVLKNLAIINGEEAKTIKEREELRKAEGKAKGNLQG
jgi:hypothetical protein